MMARARSGHWASLAAPAAFLLGVTIAVLLVRGALDDGSSPARKSRSTPVHSVGNPANGNQSRSRKPRYTIVRAGDTFSTIAARSGITVARLERLNPGVRSTALFIGQRIRVG